MKVKKIVTLSQEEVIAALQSTYPALCEGSEHALYKIDYKGNPDGDPLKKGEGAIILAWEISDEPSKKKAPQ